MFAIPALWYVSLRILPAARRRRRHGWPGTRGQGPNLRRGYRWEQLADGPLRSIPARDALHVL